MTMSPLTDRPAAAAPTIHLWMLDDREMSMLALDALPCLS